MAFKTNNPYLKRVFDLIEEAKKKATSPFQKEEVTMPEGYKPYKSQPVETLAQFLGLGKRPSTFIETAKPVAKTLLTPVIPGVKPETTKVIKPVAKSLLESVAPVIPETMKEMKETKKPFGESYTAVQKRRYEERYGHPISDLSVKNLAKEEWGRFKKQEELLRKPPSSLTPEEKAEMQKMKKEMESIAIGFMPMGEMKFVTQAEADKIISNAVKLTREDLKKITTGAKVSPEKLRAYKIITESPNGKEELLRISQNKKIPLTKSIGDYFKSLFVRPSVEKPSEIKQLSGKVIVSDELKPLAEQAKLVKNVDELKDIVVSAGKAQEISKALSQAGFKNLGEFWNKVKGITPAKEIEAVKTAKPETMAEVTKPAAKATEAIKPEKEPIKTKAVEEVEKEIKLPTKPTKEWTPEEIKKWEGEYRKALEKVYKPPEKKEMPEVKPEVTPAVEKPAAKEVKPIPKELEPLAEEANKKLPKPEVKTEIQPEKLVTETEEIKPPKPPKPPTPPTIGEIQDMPDDEIINTLTETLKETKTLRTEQEKLYAQERAKKFAKMMGVRGTAEGEAGFFAEKGALKGEMPKLDFEPIRQSLSQPVIDRLYNIIRQARVLGEWEKINAQTGLYKILEGRVPTREEINLLDSVFGSDFTKALLDKRPVIQKMTDLGMQLYNLPRSFMAGIFDFSATLMQNLMLAYRHPLTTAKNFPKEVKAFFSGEYFQAMQRGIVSDNLYPVMKEAKLPLTELGGIVGKREETFMASIAEKIPIIGPLIRATGRSYTLFLNLMRADTFKSYYNSAKLAGVDVKDPKFLEDLGKGIGDLTGRGSLGSMERMMPVLSQGLFSARKLAATFNLINPVHYIKMHPFVRRKLLEAWLAFFGGGLTILGLAKLNGAKVGDEPTSSDYGKILIGNTRINVWGSFQSIMVLFARLWKQKITSSTTGKEMELGEGYKPTTSFDIIERFFEAKEHPTLSYIIGLTKGTNQLGEKFDWDKEALTRFIPMVFQDSYDLFKEHGATGISFFGTILAMLGIPIQTYKPEIQYTEPILKEIERLRENKKLRDVVGYGAYIPGYTSLSLKENDAMQREAEKIANDEISKMIVGTEYKRMSEKEKANAIKNTTKKAINTAKANIILQKIKGLSEDELLKTLIQFKAEGLLNKTIFDLVKKKDIRVIKYSVDLEFEEEKAKPSVGTLKRSTQSKTNVSLPSLKIEDVMKMKAK